MSLNLKRGIEGTEVRFTIYISIPVTKCDLNCRRIERSNWAGPTEVMRINLATCRSKLSEMNLDRQEQNFEILGKVICNVKTFFVFLLLIRLL